MRLGGDIQQSTDYQVLKYVEEFIKRDHAQWRMALLVFVPIVALIRSMEGVQR
jgi:hypothetical protein